MPLLARKCWPRLVLLFFLQAPFNDAIAQQEEAYRKSFPDGSQVYLDKEILTEFRSRPRSANLGAPEHSLFLKREFKLVTYWLYLRRAGSTEPALLWHTSSEYYVEEKRLGSLSVLDTFVSKAKAYVIYATFFSVRVDNVERGKDGKWSQTSSTDLARQSETRPVIRAIFLGHHGPKIHLEILEGDRKVDREGNPRIRPVTFALKANRWRKQ